MIYSNGGIKKLSRFIIYVNTSDLAVNYNKGQNIERIQSHKVTHCPKIA